MNDQDEMFEAATETPAFLGCPQHMPTHLPSGFDGVEPRGEVVDGSRSRTEDVKSSTVGLGLPTTTYLEELKKRGEKLKASNDRSYAKMNEIARIANECIQRTTHAEYEPGQYGQDYRTFGKVMSEIRELVGPGLAEMFAALPPNDKPIDPSAPEMKTQSEIQREEARQKRKIHWKVYPTKVDLCAMGKTEQNGKVYEVRISKRGDSKVQDTYGQCKVNGKTVITCIFTGNAWMLKRILTEGMQALVNYKAKKRRDSRRNYAKLDAAAKAAKKGGAK